MTFEKDEDDAEAFTINTTGYGVTHDGFIQVDLTMSNHMQKIVEVNSAEPDDGNLNLAVALTSMAATIRQIPSLLARTICWSRS